MVDINIDIMELYYIGFKQGLIISGMVGIVSVGIKYSLRLLQRL